MVLRDLTWELVAKLRGRFQLAVLQALKLVRSIASNPPSGHFFFGISGVRESKTYGVQMRGNGGLQIINAVSKHN